MPGLTSDITSALSTLCRGCEGVEAVLSMSTDGNRFSRALTDLQQLAQEQKIPIAILSEAWQRFDMAIRQQLRILILRSAKISWGN